MPSVIRIVALVMFGLALSPPARAAAPIEDRPSIAVGAWNGGAYRNARGELEHCAVSSVYSADKGGFILVFQMSADYRFAIGLSSRTWQLSPGKEYVMGFAVDAHPQVALDGAALAPDLVSAILPGGHPIFEQIRNGRQLFLHAAGETHRFELNGSARALDALRACVAANAPPRSASGPGVQGAGGRLPARLGDKPFDVIAFGRLMVERQALSDARIVQLRQGAKPPDAFMIWEADGVSGAMHDHRTEIWPYVQKDFAGFIARAGEMCPDEFVTSAEQHDLVHVQVVRAAATCSADGRSQRFLYLPDAGGGFISVIHTAGSPAAARNADDRYIAALKAFLAKN
jgi:hypothetical protein